jgi:hypothetical protein
MNTAMPRSKHSTRGPRLPTWLLAALFGLLTTAACHTMLPLGNGAGSIRMLDSGIVGDPSMRDTPIWIDNDRILFVERTMEKRIRASSGQEFHARRVVLWDLRSREVKRLHELTGFVCYRNGYFHSALWDFVAPERFPVTHTYGQLDQGLHTLQAEWKKPDLDRATCRLKTDSPPATLLAPWTQGKKISRLDEIDGLLLLDSEQQDSLRNLPVTFHPHGEANGVVMPFNSREHHVQGYHPFKGAYFVLASYFVRAPGHPDGGYGHSPWPKGISRPYWWLSADGSVHTGSLASRRELYDTSILPFRDGIAWTIGFVRGEGLYAEDQLGERQLLSGFVEQAVTSPNGCRIVMKHRKSINTPWTEATLKVVELCTEDSK